MHELLKHVLTERDLTRAGDIFAISNSEIVDDLNEVIKQITEISSRPDYCRNDRDQALIEICVTRVTSCVKETGTLEKYCGALVSLLESCLNHNLMPVGHLRDDDPPHAKIASDIIACIVLVSFPIQCDKENRGNKIVMELFLPVAVQFLHKGNREISRHMARYLSLAAVHHAVLLKPHVQTIMDSIMSGNYPLCRILTNLYEVCPEPLEGHTMALASLLPHAEPLEKNSLLALFEQMAARKPEALKTCIPQLISLLCPSTTSQSDPGCMCIDILQLLVCVAAARAALVAEHGAAVRRAARGPHASPRAVSLVAQLLTHVGYTSRERAQEALNFLVEVLPGAERQQQAVLMRDATALCSAFPALFTDQLLNAVRAKNSKPKGAVSSEVNRTSTGVTIVKLSGAGVGAGAGVQAKGAGTGAGAGVGAGAAGAGAGAGAAGAGGYTRRAKLGDSRSTGRLHPGPNSHRSMTRLNVAGGSVGGLHKSMTRLSSSQQINSQQNVASAANANSKSGGGSGGGGGGKPGGVTVTTVGGAGGRAARAGGGAAPGAGAGARGAHHHHIVIGAPPATSIAVSPSAAGKSSDALGHVAVLPAPAAAPGAVPGAAPGAAPPVTVTSRRANNTSVTMITAGGGGGGGEGDAAGGAGAGAGNNHRISVFEPYPLRDTVQHFCEKHLDKIKAYMDNVSLRLPPPAKCTIEERRSKKQARLQFGCGSRGPHCLFARAPFSMRTRSARVWIHLMFLALQARRPAALSSRDASVASLKHCWDILKCENKTFLTLVTGAFPGIKEQEMLLNELRAAGFFDVFEVRTTRTDGATLPPTQATWGCFLCNHPERALGFLAGDGQPVIEGQLKEKKGRWRLFRRWRTRYFTLSGAHLSCKGSSGGESIDINQIRSVKVSRGARNIPKAFEIFTGDQTLILKPKDGKDAEQWVQCLSIAVAHSQARDSPAKANSLPARGLTLKSL